ncbi:MAG: hypothetical protein ABI832_09985 [bacterium]
MFRLVAFVLMILPQVAEADIYARLSVLFGDPEVPEEACSVNPVYSRFTDDHNRAVFSWGHPVPSYTGAMITAYGSTVLWADAGSITMVRDHETRLTPEGDKVLWIMRATDQPEGYCWHRIDWPDDSCLQLVRCPSEGNS